jgi:cell pole-organizing protein PopZ
MEEILASIRRIIADDQSRSRLTTTKLVPVPVQPGERPVAAEQASEAIETQAAIIDVPEARAPASAPEGEGIAAGAETVAMAPQEAHLAEGAVEARAVDSSALSDAVTEPEPSHYGAPEPSAMASLSASGLAPVAKLEAEVAKLVQDTFAQEGFAQQEFPQEGFAQQEFVQPLHAHDDEAREEALHEVEEAAASEMPAPAAPIESRYAAPATARLSAPAADPRARQPMPARAPQSAAAGPDRRDTRSSEPRDARVAARPETRSRDAGAILSSETDLAVARAFNTLSRTVLSDNARTLEDLVSEMLRPLLKAWLDDNLPSVVERLVRMEIERVARGRPAD